MGKLVKLAFRGELDLGYEVELVEIREDSQGGTILAGGKIAKLPPATKVYQDYLAWQQIYELLTPLVRGLRKVKSQPVPTDISVSACQRAAARLRKSFNSWLDDRDFLLSIHMALRTEAKRHENVRMIIQTEDYKLWQLPWSTWNFFEDYSKAEITFSPPEMKESEKPLLTPKRKQVRILAVCGNDDSIDYHPDQEILKRLHSVGAEPEFLQKPTPTQVRDNLREKQWDILFFAGHSKSEKNLQTGQFYLNIDDILTPESLEHTLKIAIKNGLKIALLNSCDGLGLARKMVEEFGVPIVIAMRAPVPNQFAQEFLEFFMLEYAKNQQPLCLAVRKARERLAEEWRDKLPCVDWLPVICQNPAIKPPLWSDLYRPISAVQVGAASLLSTSLIVAMRFLGWLQPMELTAFDHLMRMRPQERPDERILIVEITDKDYEKYNHPLNDRTTVRLLDKLMEYQPAAIGLDLYRRQKYEPGHKEFSEHLRKNDRLFTICRAGNPEATKDQDNQVGIGPPPDSPPDNVGFSDFPLDPDGILRRHLLHISKQKPCPTNVQNIAFSVKLAVQYFKTIKGIEADFDGDNLKLSNTVFTRLRKHQGFYHKIDDRGRYILLNYRSPQTPSEKVSLTKILEEGIAPDLVKDRIILIGGTFDNAGDKKLTPYGTAPNQGIPGVLIHAHMVSQMISAALGERPLLWFWPIWGDISWIGFWSLAGGFIVWGWQKSLHQSMALATALSALTGICFVVLVTKAGCLPLVPSALAIVVTSRILLVYTTSKTDSFSQFKTRFTSQGAKS
ncbi:MAG: CHASE2 domain-containing protein [Actinomycetota bacterium]